MKKKVSGKTVNQIMTVGYWFMVVARVLFFALFVAGVVAYISGRYRVAGYLLMMAAALGGIVEPAMAGGYKAASKDLDRQQAMQRRTVASATDEEIGDIQWSDDLGYLVVKWYDRDIMYLGGGGIWSSMQADGIRMKLSEAAVRAMIYRERGMSSCRVMTETGATTIF
jgi:hypothetical protein